MAKYNCAITPKQEAFASAYVETGNATEAYRRAYDVDPNATDEWISVEACQLLNHPKVAPRVTELQQELAELRSFTRFRAMEELDEAREMALTEKQSAAAIRATEAKIKMLGLNAPLRQELTGRDGGPILTEQVTLDASTFASRLSSLASRTAEGSGVTEADASSEGSS